jgi:peptidoglycan-N-acetylglucosamine deacetylase
MRFYKPPHIARCFFKDAIWNFPREKGKFFLTFDDGPSEITPAILDILKQYNIKAVFFCVGKQIEKFPDHFKNIITEGHAVGNHSYSHLNGWRTKTKAYLDDVAKAEILVSSKLFRPPFGKITLRQFHQLKKKYSLVFWELMSYDFDPRLSVEDLFINLRKNISDGSVIVFHDFQAAFPRNIECLKKLFKEYDSNHFAAFPSL